MLMFMFLFFEVVAILLASWLLRLIVYFLYIRCCFLTDYSLLLLVDWLVGRLE